MGPMGRPTAQRHIRRSGWPPVPPRPLGDHTDETLCGSCGDWPDFAHRGERARWGLRQGVDLNSHALAGTGPSSFPPGTLANWHKPIWRINKGFCLRRKFTVCSGRAIILRGNPSCWSTI